MSQLNYEALNKTILFLLKYLHTSSQLLQNRVDVNFTNEHGNSPLHYACFWGYSAIAEDLVMAGALVSMANQYGDTPLDKTRGQLVQR